MVDLTGIFFGIAVMAVSALCEKMFLCWFFSQQLTLYPGSVSPSAASDISEVSVNAGLAAAEMRLRKALYGSSAEPPPDRPAKQENQAGLSVVL